ncbi:pyridoxal phosphate-dependent aminotransferase [Ruoffia sp. FAM 26255]|uniref:pyridoxal phosphate-dependent aminotransferase n=1 Tax=Ruoffia sp. FAM 26255 TaxID=3259519 RepID=UPI00388A23B8
MELNNLFNTNLTKIKPNAIRAFDESASQVEGIIKLTLGEPDFNTPEHVKDAGIKAIQDNQTGYLSTPGDNRLRQAAANFVKEKYDLNYQWEDEVIVTVGATESLSTALQTICNPGDKIIVPSPYFTLYSSIIYLAGGEPIEVDTAANDFVMSPEMLKDTLEEHGDAVKGIILNYPTNPTGVNWKEEDAKAFADVLRDRPIFVISDEVYSELVYEEAHVSIAKYIREQTIVINGVSKSHAMTGWRVGLLFAPANIMSQLVKVHQNLVTTNSTISQLAAREALENGMNDAQLMREKYVMRRDYIYDFMTRLGFKIVKPSGAFYMFARIPEDLEQNSMDFCLDLAHSAAVAFVPGSAFGIGGESHVRLSYAASIDDIKEAMRRLEVFVKEKRENK